MNNISIATFKCGSKSCELYGLWQYDYGQILRIQDLGLPPAVEIHFSLTEKGGTSVTRVGTTKDGVTDVVIPDSLLENDDASQDYWIYAYIYLTDETSGSTEYKIAMKVKSRPRPEAIDRPEDQELFREAIAAVNEAADRAEIASVSSEESAEDAKSTLVEIKETSESLSENLEKAEELGENLREKLIRGEDIVANIKDKVDSPANPIVGKYLRVKSVSKAGVPELEWVDMIDVQIDGQSIVKDGVAEIPLLTGNSAGLVKIDPYAIQGGIYMANAKTGLIRLNTAPQNTIDERNNRYCPITPDNLDYAVKAAMCDGKGEAWTEDEQASARDRLGIGEWEKIAEIVIPDDAEEADALTIDRDMNNQPFELVKARLYARFPKYTGETDIPAWSFSMLNGVYIGENASLQYTSVYPKVSKNIISGTTWEIDVSGVFQIERTIRNTNNAWSDKDDTYGTTNDNIREIHSDRIRQKPIKSIGGKQMLIYPGCKFVLYGVRA